MRDSGRIIRNWYPLIKNRVYFGMRHALNHYSVEDVIEAGVRDALDWEARIIEGKKESLYSQSDLERFYREVKAGIRDGHKRGLEPARYLQDFTLAEHQSPFISFPLNAEAEERQVVCLLKPDASGQNGEDMQRFDQFAKTLARDGQHVHLLTVVRGPASLDYEDGIWVHRIEIQDFSITDSSLIATHAMPEAVRRRCQAMLDEVWFISKRRKIDMLYCSPAIHRPLAALLRGKLPLAIIAQDGVQSWPKTFPLQDRSKIATTA